MLFFSLKKIYEPKKRERKKDQKIKNLTLSFEAWDHFFGFLVKNSGGGEGLDTGTFYLDLYFSL